jgi:hypothetical protein
MARKPVDVKGADDAQQSSFGAARSPRRHAPSTSTHRGESATEPSFCMSYSPHSATHLTGVGWSAVPAGDDLRCT